MKFIVNLILTIIINILLINVYSKESTNFKKSKLSNNLSISSKNENKKSEMSHYQPKYSFNMRQRCNKDSGLMTIEEKKFILITINRIRNQIATQSTSLGPKLPYARNMLQMYYSDSLGASAQAVADRCMFKHSDPAKRKQPQFYVGETIFKMKFINGNPEKNWQNAIEDWLSQIKDVGGKSMVQYNVRGPNTEDFTQLIWANTFLVGCGFASYSDTPKEITHLYVCHFGPAGNIINAPVYDASYWTGCNCPANLGCNNITFPGLCCPSGHCNHNSIEYNGEPFKGTIPDS